ncbi:MAG TPA: hypothetical protein PLH11_08880 [Gemmobacter sp.]|nr:hypothetical protein [Gemmobacter sp.]
MSDLPLDPQEQVELRFDAPVMPGWSHLTPQRRLGLGGLMLALVIMLWPAWQAAAAASAFMLGLAVLGDVVNRIWCREGVLTDRRVFLVTRIAGRVLPLWQCPRAEVYFRGQMQFNRLASRRNGMTVKRLGVLAPGVAAALKAALPGKTGG